MEPHSFWTSLTSIHPWIVFPPYHNFQKKRGIGEGRVKIVQIQFWPNFEKSYIYTTSLFAKWFSWIISEERNLSTLSCSLALCCHYSFAVDTIHGYYSYRIFFRSSRTLNYFSDLDMYFISKVRSIVFIKDFPEIKFYKLFWRIDDLKS